MEDETAMRAVSPAAVLANDVLSSSANGLDAMFANTEPRHPKINDHAVISVVAGVKPDTNKQHQQITLVDAVLTPQGYALLTTPTAAGSAGITFNAPTNASIGVASGTALAANTLRKYALFVNDSAATIYLSLSGAAAEVSKGVRINASGGSYEMSASFGNLCTNAITAIATGAASTLCVIEGT